MWRSPSVKFYQKLSKISPKNEQSKNLYITINDSKILRIHHDTVRLSVLTNFNNHHHQTKRVADPKTIYNQVIKLLVIQSLGYKFHDEKKLIYNERYPTNRWLMMYSKLPQCLRAGNRLKQSQPTTLQFYVNHHCLQSYLQPSSLSSSYIFLDPPILHRNYIQAPNRTSHTIARPQT